MSRTSLKKVRNCSVMVRAYGDEPVRLLARGHLGDAVELEFEGGGEVIFFPSDDVFEFDSQLFGELQNAFRAGERERLVSSWEKAKRFEN